MKENITSENNNETNQAETAIKKKKKVGPAVLAIIIVGVVVIVAAIIVTSVGVFGKKARINRKLNSATNYISQLNYENAIADYDGILEIDPKYLDAYIGKANVYAAMDNYDSAIETLSAGYEETDSANFDMYDSNVKVALCEMAANSSTGENLGKSIDKIRELDEEYRFSKEQLEAIVRTSFEIDGGVKVLVKKFKASDFVEIDEELFVELSIRVPKETGKAIAFDYINELSSRCDSAEKLLAVYKMIIKYLPEYDLSWFNKQHAENIIENTPGAVKVEWYDGESYALDENDNLIMNSKKSGETSKYSSDTIYDSQGRVKEESYGYGDEKYKTVYDYVGNEIRITYYDFYNWGVRPGKGIKRYDEYGRLIYEYSKRCDECELNDYWYIYDCTYVYKTVLDTGWDIEYGRNNLISNNYHGIFYVKDNQDGTKEVLEYAFDEESETLRKAHENNTKTLYIEKGYIHCYYGIDGKLIRLENPSNLKCFVKGVGGTTESEINCEIEIKNNLSYEYYYNQSRNVIGLLVYDYENGYMIDVDGRKITSAGNDYYCYLSIKDGDRTVRKIVENEEKHLIVEVEYDLLTMKENYARVTYYK